MSSCKIELHNDSYRRPGDVIEGMVVCTFSNSEDIEDIRVKLTGEEHTQSVYLVPSEVSAPKELKNTFFSTQEIFASAGRYTAGHHDFPFVFDLPKNIPGTYLHYRGWIKFFITAVVHKKGYSEYRDVKEIEIVAPVDFNVIENELEQQPITRSLVKNVPSFCCFDGPIAMTVYLPKRAFVQGRSAVVMVDINSMLDEDVRAVQLKIKRTLIVKVPERNSPIVDDQLLVNDLKGGVSAKTDKTYRFKVSIPTSPVMPNFNLCKLFRQKISVEVIADVPSVYMRISIPIIIGQVPLSKLGNNTIPADSESSLSSTEATNGTSIRERDVLRRGVQLTDCSDLALSPVPPGQFSTTVSGEAPVAAVALYPPSLPGEPKPLLASRGPVPYSSFRQRPVGFAVPKPLSSSERLPVPRSVDGPVPVPTANSASSYPPTAGPSMPLPESPPSYESVFGKHEESANIYSSSLSSKRFPTSSGTVSNDVPHPLETNRPSAPPSRSPTSLYPPESPPPTFLAASSIPHPNSMLYRPSTCFPPMPLPPPRSSISAPVSESVSYPPASSMPHPDPDLYPPEARASVSSINFPPMPFPNTSDKPTLRWDIIRSAIGAQRVPTTSNPPPYPPEDSLPRDNSVRFAHSSTSASVPSDGLYPPPRDESSSFPRSSVPSRTAPYPKESSPPKCDTIGFAVRNDDVERGSVFEVEVRKGTT